MVSFSTLPKTAQAILDWTWAQFEPYFTDLANRTLTAENAAQWLADWSRIDELAGELGTRGQVATTVNTADEEAKKRYETYLDTIYPALKTAQQTLKQKLLDSGLEPKGFEIPLRNMRAEAEIYREANLPLLSEEQKLGLEYDAIAGAQTVMWEGKEYTMAQMAPFYLTEDRATREKIWRLQMERRMADREKINALWAKFMNVRRQIGTNAGFTNYRDYCWRKNWRFDYTPEDCRRFHEAIEEAVVPVLKRVHERYRQRLGVETLRPWDVVWFGVPMYLPALKPFKEVLELETKSEAIFRRVDPQLGEYFATMRREGLLDLGNRMNKAPGGYCTTFEAARRPFIFMNAVGLQSDVETVLHEGGHAFHAFEAAKLPYIQQQYVPAEFAEVASMAMEHLAALYLKAAEGGFYTDSEYARARTEHLEHSVLFWPYMAVVDAFQHWIYENHDAATDANACGEKWAELFARFVPTIDWSGLETELKFWWHRQLHIFQIPFYYVEYGLAQLGAMQVWGNALKNQADAVAHYRKALALGYTLPLPKLFEAAGAKFAFDAATLRQAVALADKTLEELAAQV